ncbi:efflux RND transporter periplasmic adaptor subunit [Xanthomonas euvesicatoria pv. eucalypti]|uniref:efflux RND transporter periplasmic adaptor subunit n=1 Tax=Xanthomonas euvesicatoria TaxID=456327 RepID=UPI000226651F|nr:efflux RND transporter periplasmic adaptor subunit [Xanthomonas euvesicatoria]AEO40623.1 membrane fusion protein [Xanthomonas euvesicatoria pv. citrumelo F1]MBV6776307.1 efflux RND transporter periplasmic adaptor subunit [Xanthomonas campestris pv. carissae]MDO7931690.1 efflux RND transporter periplasmic adaptor subunit [Xanthomonas euvesicatoria pv. eucalypti]MDO7935968.1 efflux RND transporter periplasmic adaptor subunit [Xanthomonas euvesicatoria pv. eucalypti]MDO7940155.1 efflux RND tra
MLPVATHRFRTASVRLLLLAAATTLMAACSSRQPPQMPQTQVGVQTLKVQRLAVDQTLSGRTVAYVTSDVRPQVGGILRKRLFTEGQDVQAGQVLYEIDPASYQAAYDTAKGDLAQAEAAVLSARPKAQRYQTLVGLDAVSKQDGDDALATLRSNEAAVVAAKASLQTARINLDYTRITAPVSGRIGTSSYTPGALVSAGQSEVLATINQLDPIYVDVTQSSAQLLQLRRQLDTGQLKAVDGKAEVTLQLEDGSTYAHSGTLEVVDAAVDTATGTVKLRAVVPNPERVLLPGMYVTAKLSMAVDEQAILVPQQAISRNSKGQAVAMVVGSDNKVAQRVLTTGDAIVDKWVVRQGLKAGDKVIVQGLQKASVGAEVRAVEVSQTAAADSAANASPSTQGTAAAAPKAD